MEKRYREMMDEILETIRADTIERSDKCTEQMQFIHKSLDSQCADPLFHLKERLQEEIVKWG
jgi:hypothetical protein